VHTPELLEYHYSKQGLESVSELNVFRPPSLKELIEPPALQKRSSVYNQGASAKHGTSQRLLYVQLDLLPVHVGSSLSFGESDNLTERHYSRLILRNGLQDVCKGQDHVGIMDPHPRGLGSQNTLIDQLGFAELPGTWYFEVLHVFSRRLRTKRNIKRSLLNYNDRSRRDVFRESGQNEVEGTKPLI